MQYHSLRHRTLLPSPVTFTARCCFCFVSISSFFHFSTLLQWHIGHLTTWAVHLSMPYIFAFSYCSWGSQGKNTEVTCHSLLFRTEITIKNLMDLSKYCKRKSKVAMGGKPQGYLIKQIPPQASFKGRPEGWVGVGWGGKTVQ